MLPPITSTTTVYLSAMNCIRPKIHGLVHTCNQPTCTLIIPQTLNQTAGLPKTDLTLPQTPSQITSTLAMPQTLSHSIHTKCTLSLPHLEQIPVL